MRAREKHKTTKLSRSRCRAAEMEGQQADGAGWQAVKTKAGTTGIRTKKVEAAERQSMRRQSSTRYNRAAWQRGTTQWVERGHQTRCCRSGRHRSRARPPIPTHNKLERWAYEFNHRLQAGQAASRKEGPSLEPSCKAGSRGAVKGSPHGKHTTPAAPPAPACTPVSFV